ncbi:DNA methylase [Chloracidobacterium validum]|uniref:Methyltransferase n=1 Tax=Chloracidobacterium validum TaxID=2821543 RepID=A0ABX8BE05_9BACT|nr:DNA methyltransferase [Chloracidobacterium validum]QUW04105.1 DNA methylase [Chloracidobacterium validum]
MKSSSSAYNLPLFHDPLDNGAEEQETPKPKRTSPLNDLDLNRWREYDDITTDSLWLIPERDRSGAHLADYHGNFVPQIPYQAMRRFTKRGDLILDAFLGSGTSLIECRRLGRHGIGIELKPELAQQADDRIASQSNPYNVKTIVLTGDSSNTVSTPRVITHAVEEIGKEQVQLVFLHPPYHSIIKFSDQPEDLSNCPSVESFIQKFGQVVDVVTPFLETGRFLVLVIGDMYAASEWIPLGFHCMQEVIGRGFSLKSIVVKDMQGNRAKRNLENIWRYRALAGGFYIFKHEYVMFFRKGIRNGRTAI